MRVGLVQPRNRNFRMVRVDNMSEVHRLLGLKPGQTDDGALASLPTRGRIHYICYQHAMMVPCGRQHYWALGSKLLAGPTVLYECDAGGRTIDLSPEWKIAPRWFKSAADIEAAIAKGEIVRPQFAVNDEVLWQWPQPATPDIEAQIEEDMQ